MDTVISIACFALAVLSFAWGLVTEYRQGRDQGPVAVVPTLPFAIMASCLVWFGLAWYPQELPMMVYVVAIPGAPVIFILAILKASAKRSAAD